MCVVAINGSPRKGGNTEFLLKEVLSELHNAGWGNRACKGRRNRDSQLYCI